MKNAPQDVYRTHVSLFFASMIRESIATQLQLLVRWHCRRVRSLFSSVGNHDLCSTTPLPFLENI
jgi:hypothetical protein